LSLRLRLAVAFALLAFLVGALEALTGYLSFRNLVEQDIRRDLLDLAAQIRQNLVLAPSGPELPGTELFARHYIFGFRVLDGEKPLLERGFLPKEGEAWQSLRQEWQGYTLEIYLRVEEYRQALKDFRRAAFLPLLPLFLLSGLLGLFLARRFTWPLESLGRALEHLSRLRFPDPLGRPPEPELAQVVAAFNRVVAAVRAALARERAFTRYVSHELRTPLAVLQAQVEALASGDADAKRALAEIERALRRMRATLEGLLELARLEAGDLEPVNLEALVRENLSEEEAALVAQGPAWVLGHRELLRRILENLLENARLHGGPPVEVGVEAEGEEVRLWVRDHGPGVPEALRGHLGKPFAKGPFGGTGLGLALVHQVVAWLGGRVAYEDARPGLRVTLFFPRWRDVEPT
jgi:signal transduction histidine kinase